MWSDCISRRTTVSQLLRVPRRAAWAPILLGLFLGLAGCSGPTEGTVSGKVTYKGNPVTEGIVNLSAPEKGLASEANLDSSGAFKLPGSLPLGNYKISLQPPRPQQLPPGSPAPKAANLAIPTQYQDANRTPLTRDVKAGSNDFSIELTD